MVVVLPEPLGSRDLLDGGPAGVTVDPSESAIAGWVEPPNYAFTLDSRCGERTIIGRFRVDVREHLVSRVEGLDAQGRNVAASVPYEDVPTLAQLIQRVVWARYENAHEARLETDPATGRPVSVTIDPDQMTLDDEECYEISDLLILTK